MEAAAADHGSAVAVRIMARTLKWIGLGATLMYFFDPDRGRSRRSRVRDGIIHLLNQIDHEIEVTTHDVINRTHGLIAQTRSFLADDHAPDRVIVARVRTKLGRLVSHPRAIQVDARGGHVILSGPVLAAERDRLLAAARSVRGVVDVEDRLQVYERPSEHPALRGGMPRTGERSELWQKTWSPAMRLLAVATAGAVALRISGARRRSVGLALGTVGAGLIIRGLTKGNPWRGRSSDAPTVATGAPVHDIAIPISRSRRNEPDMGHPGLDIRCEPTMRNP
jgi:hypothetical protein